MDDNWDPCGMILVQLAKQRDWLLPEKTWAESEPSSVSTHANGTLADPMKTGETEIIPVGISGRQNNTVSMNWNQE